MSHCKLSKGEPLKRGRSGGRSEISEVPLGQVLLQAAEATAGEGLGL